MRFLTLAVLVLVFAPGPRAQSAERLPLWFARPVIRFDPALVRLADAGCPAAWPFSGEIYEGVETFRKGDGVHIPYGETCSEIQLVRKEQRLSDTLDALYLRLGELWHLNAEMDPEGRLDMRPRLVEVHEAWKRHTDVESRLDMDLAAGRTGAATREILIRGHEDVDARLRWVAEATATASARIERRAADK